MGNWKFVEIRKLVRVLWLGLVQYTIFDKINLSYNYHSFFIVYSILKKILLLKLQLISFARLN